MLSLRKVRLITFLITFGVGVLALSVWHPSDSLGSIDQAIAPAKNESFQIGALLEDRSSPNLRQSVTRKVVPPRPLDTGYLLCQIDDDPEQLNAFGIYHPLDLAITLGHLHEQGIETVYLSTHLVWPDLDEAERSTLSTALSPFRSVVISTPLKRSIQDSPIPSVFYAASCPLEQLQGDPSLLPMVNSLSVPPNITFNENTLAGFSQLESEQATSSLPLIARWGDRLVFSSLLLELMVQAHTTLEKLTIIPGQYIRLGNTGRVIPIDTFGHFKPSDDVPITQPARSISSAMSSESSIIGATQKAAFITASGEQSSQYNTIDSPYLTLCALAYSPSVGEATISPRLPIWLETSLLAIIAGLASISLTSSSLKLHATYALSLFITWMILLLMYHTIHFNSPASVYLCTLTTAWLTCLLGRRLLSSKKLTPPS